MRSRRSLFAPARVAHAWFDGEASGGGTAVADPPAAPSADTPPADPPKSDAELHALRTKAGRLEAELEKIKKDQQARADADLSEVDRLKKQIADQTAQMEQQATAAKMQRLTGASLAAAARLGFADPEDAHRFLDPDKVEWDDAGNPTNVTALLEGVLKAKAYLKGSYTQPPDLGQGTRGRSGVPLTRESIAKMSSAEINSRWDEVQAVLGKG